MSLTRPSYGDLLDPAMADEYADAIEALQTSVGALQTPTIAELRQSNSATQTLTSGAFASINFDVEDVDSGSAHSTVTNTSRWVAPATGYVRLNGGGVCFASNATGFRATRWAVNGTAVNASASTVNAVSGNVTDCPARGKVIHVTIGDYVELQGFQNSGGNLATSSSGADASSASITWESN